VLELDFFDTMSTLEVYSLCLVLFKGEAMLEVNIKEARSNFSQLLNKVEQGQDILLIRRGKKVARLVPPEKNCSLPSLKEFRQTISLSGEELSSVVQEARDKERY